MPDLIYVSGESQIGVKRAMASYLGSHRMTFIRVAADGHLQSKSAPNGGSRASAVTSDRDAALVPFRPAADLIADYAFAY